MKKFMFAVVLAGILMMLAGCSGNERVRIAQNSIWIDNMVLAIRNGYRLAEDVYSIRETEAGYDIVIHAVADGEPGDG